VQQLIDVRNQLDRYASPEIVEWHFSSITNRWTKRALASAGFGFPAPLHQQGDLWHRWKPIFSVAELGGYDSAAGYAEWQVNDDIQHEVAAEEVVGQDIETNVKGIKESYGKEVSTQAREQKDKKVVTVNGVNRPLFHVDLTVALQSAIHNAEKRQGATAKIIVEDVADFQEH
jgi:solute carrier family 26 (sodium-independent sulfate anion transporter), member 11